MTIGMKTVNWYNEISRSLDKIPDCINHFEAEYQKAKQEVKLYGNLERASAALPGIVEERFSQLQQIEAILEYLNIELRRLRSKSFKKFLENYNRALSSRDAEKYVDGDDDVVNLTQIANQFSLLRNQYLGIMKGLDTKQWQIGHIVRLRTAGMEDISL